MRRLQLLERWRIWRARRNLQKALVAHSGKITLLEQVIEYHGQRLDHCKTYFEQEHAAVTEQMTQAMLEAEALNARTAALKREIEIYERTLESLRSRLQIAEEVSIPSLVAANRLALERYNADTAVQLKRKTEGK